MRRISLLFVPLMVATFLLAISSTKGVKAQVPGEVVNEPPPAAPQQDMIPPQPSPQSVWTPGHWQWEPGNSWVWVPGQWAEPPYPNGVWIPGHWFVRPDGMWQWIRGHWAYN